LRHAPLRHRFRLNAFIHGPFSTRRSLLLAAVSAPFVAACTSAPIADQGRAHVARSELAALDKASNGRLGVAALDTSNGTRIAHHARERFPLCGTYAVVAAAADPRACVARCIAAAASHPVSPLRSRGRLAGDGEPRRHGHDDRATLRRNAAVG
jgi:hypothetical protein